MDFLVFVSDNNIKNQHGSDELVPVLPVLIQFNRFNREVIKCQRI